MIRNQWGYTNTNTSKSSLPKKACDKQASLPALRQGAARGCSRKGAWGNPVRDPAEGPLGFPQIRSGHVNDLENL
ncbi:hypothetical protein HMPREF0072_1372 [Anaerococcus lactolyticus ATCC 51172]|uniref:Uncharacterized protein n=1 Tax=Anaerococcus lactolyticus ATCC 51172 TaxID=525254 RepID=C2BGA2_9FIRM|nr:hypothetical protein HMPREF0072_1372 [Anaerococcus lactolyticus ATCC 51172]